MRVYDEPLTEVDVDPAAPADVPPAGWVWRGRRYVTVGVVEWWVTTAEWWLRADIAVDGPMQIRNWRLEAASDHGQGVVEISHDAASDAWLLRRMLD